MSVMYFCILSREKNERKIIGKMRGIDTNVHFCILYRKGKIERKIIGKMREIDTIVREGCGYKSTHVNLIMLLLDLLYK